MQEREFISSIDSCFPYSNPMRWRRLVAQAPNISANAAFMVIHELCRPPRSISLTEEHAHLILSHLSKRFRHPLIKILRPAIYSHLNGTLLPTQKAAYLMRRVAAYSEQHNALAICYFSAHDKSGKLDRIYEQISNNWAKA